MAEVSSVGIICGSDLGCEGEGEGERGERGKRGHRGHRGHDGHDGHDGATGPTGPSGGPTGPTGSTGPIGPTGTTGATGPTSGGPAFLASAVVSGNVIASNRAFSPGTFLHIGPGHYSYALVAPVANPNNVNVLVSVRDDFTVPQITAVEYIVDPDGQTIEFFIGQGSTLVDKNFSFAIYDLT